ncbi:dTDP-4-dehydrorhamnose reductase [Desulfobacula phenolica]|uniref:dTDP-4-dehydrorhamnose reductase n=1 Tax=Desulfobacula phenolica TaxID=90732 RepID=A0A1H2DPI0_9BACT|nr:dTDP-4-dehydrorhamnose reductase [Desulfobacula phenolica]SDT84716.1 dTDP-4-dehydrorhamnose reductase [Desulfobacula phenolica]
MKVLVIGANGQLGWELARTCPDSIGSDSVELTALGSSRIDLCSTQSIQRCIRDTSPDCIINAAAYTAVDRAEQEIAAAYQLNRDGVSELAMQAKKNKISLVHISTDFVFNGENFKPYTPYDHPCPGSVYGKSKLEGERAVKRIIGSTALIIRTAWLYSAHGHNFVKTLLKLMAEKESLKVIDEQIGSPTWALGLAKAIWVAIEKEVKGIFHWTDAGVASWYDFAMAIQEEGLDAGLLSRAIPIFPVSTSEYPTPAKRPMYGVLDKRSMWQATGITPVHWRVQLRAMLKQVNLKELN